MDDRAEEVDFNRRLIDEAIAEEPVKNTFRLGWEMFTLNKQFSFMVVLLLFGATFLGMIPLLQMPIYFMLSIAVVLLEIYIARIFYQTANIETFLEEIKAMKISHILEKSIYSPALGSFLGWSLISIAVMLISPYLLSPDYILAYLTPPNKDLLDDGALSAMMLLSMASVMSFMFAYLLFFAVFSYVFPLVHANIILSKSFLEGFKAVFSMFQIQTWNRAWRGDYFSYLFKFTMILMGAFLTVSILVSLVPLLLFPLMFLFLPMLYLFIVLMSIFYMMARRIVE